MMKVFQFAAFFVFILPTFIVGTFVSVNANQHLFLRNVDFDSLLEDDDWNWNESWFMPIAMFKAPSLRSGSLAVFARIQGKGFVKHSTPTYSLSLLNPSTGAVLFSSSFVFAKSPQVLEFTMDVPESVANSVFELRLNHFTKTVPHEPLNNSPPLTTIDGTKIPEDEGRKVFLTNNRYSANKVNNITCAIEAGDTEEEFVAVASTSQVNLRQLITSTSISPTFPSKWINVFNNAVVFDPLGSNTVIPVDTFLQNSVTERSGATSDVYFWSGSTSQGLLSPINCADWTSTSSSVSGTMGYARKGQIWAQSDKTTRDCSLIYPVLCLQVANLLPQQAENLSRLLRGEKLIYSA